MPEIDYFFQFSSEAEALADPDVSPFYGITSTIILTDEFFVPLTTGTGEILTATGPEFLSPNLRPNIWPFDLSVYPSQTQYKGYWCMIGQSTTNASLQSNSHLKFMVTLSADILFQSFRIDGTNEFITTSVAPAQKAVYAASWAIGLDTGPVSFLLLINNSNFLLLVNGVDEIELAG